MVLESLVKHRSDTHYGAGPVVNSLTVWASLLIVSVTMAHETLSLIHDVSLADKVICGGFKGAILAFWEI